MASDNDKISESNWKSEEDASSDAEDLKGSSGQRDELEMLQDAFASLNQGFNIFDQNLRLVAWNTLYFELLELPLELAVRGKPLADFFRYYAERGDYGPGNIDALVAERVARAGQAKSYRKERLLQSGKVIEIVGNPRPGGGFVSVYTDITERKNSEAKRLESELRFRDLAEIGADWFWEQDEDLRFIYLSKHVDQASARRRDEILGLTRWETVGIDPDNDEYWAKHREDLLARRPFKDFQFEYCREDGEVFYRSVSGKPLFDEDGHFLGYRGVARDMTKSRKSEEALRISEERFRKGAELTADQFWEMDEQFRFVSFTGTQGFASEVDLNRNLGKTRWGINPVDLGSDDKWRRHREDHVAHRSYTDFEFTIVNAAGETRILSTNGSPIFDSEGNFKGYFGSTRDITQRKNLEEQVRRSQKMEAVGQLTGGIAHDFNNILGIIQGNLELMESLPPGDSGNKERLRKAIKTVERGADITRKLLGFSRRDAHEVQTANINMSVRDLCSLIAKSLTVSIEIKTHLADNLWTVDIDPGDFDDAILNLALNARDAMPGGGMLAIETANLALDEDFVQHHRDATTGDYVRVSIGDTGTGMTEEVKSRILEPFFTTKELGKGTGLGLSMVYGFVERSGGFMTVDSEWGTGTTFHLYFPRTVKRDAVSKDPTNTESDLQGGAEKILIVDDEEDLREIAAFNLAELGYRTFTAEDGLSALTILEQEGDIDLLFSDVVMPNNMDAFELTERVHKRYPELKILLTSGYTPEMTATTDGFRHRISQQLLKKPYSMSEMAIAVRKALEDEG